METAVRSESSVRFQKFEFDLRTHELYRNGSRLKVRGHPVDVLAILLEHPGEMVTREVLQKRIWPDESFLDFEQSLNNSVGKLRDALGDRAQSPKFIETLPRLGYRFIAPVDEPETGRPGTLPPPVVEEQPAVPIPPISSHPAHGPRDHRIWLAFALAVAAVAVFGWWYAHLPLPAPRITHYEQLTLDGGRKIARGTDGTRVYLNLRGPGRGIAQIPVTGGKVTEFPIDLPGANEFPPWLSHVSPDGSGLLVVNQFNVDEGYKVWVVGNLGHTARYLTTAYTQALSPDGETVVYTTAHGDIYKINVNGGEPRLLLRGNAPSDQIVETHDLTWSPDGSTIRFTGDGGRIWEISSTGANLHEWFPGWNGSVQKCCGRWTPDGQFFLFLAGRALARDPTFPPLGQIWAVDERHARIRPRIAEPILLASNPLLWGNPVPSRDGKKIFVRGVSLRGELQRYDSTSKRLESYLGGISAEMPDFSRDGNYVAYVSFPDGILWRANRDGSELLQLTQSPFYPRNPRWSPDGTEILFTDNTQNGVDAIYVVASQGGTPKRLLPYDDGPQSIADWSPDGTRVVYTTFLGFSFVPLDRKRVDTCILELATGRVTILPQRPGGFVWPIWSPDGRYIAGQSNDTTELVIFDFKTGEWNALAQKSIGYPSWSHDGRFLYFVQQPKDRLGVYRFPVQGGPEELVFELPDGFRGTGWYDFWMSLDPDDAPLILRDVGTDEIYGLTLERK